MKKTFYEIMVSNLAKPAEEIQETLSPGKVHINHMLLGLTTELGELATTIKRWIIYNEELNTKNIVEELGDMEFYLEGLRQGLDLTREQILAHNTEKLTFRYGDKYSDKAAVARADKIGQVED
jgi:NTP pyrophosphatase (non-canonical NTP hydrolase)